MGDCGPCPFFLRMQLGFTPLLVACRGGHSAAAELLVAYGAEVDLASHVGVTWRIFSS